MWLPAVAFPSPEYQWFKDGAPIRGATEAELTITAANAEDAGLYHCEVSNAIGRVATSDCSVNVAERQVRVRGHGRPNLYG